MRYFNHYKLHKSIKSIVYFGSTLISQTEFAEIERCSVERAFLGIRDCARERLEVLRKSGPRIRCEMCSRTMYFTKDSFSVESR